MGDPLADLMPNPDATLNPEVPTEWEMWKVKNDSKWDFSIPVNDSKNKVPVTFKAGQVRLFPKSRAEWIAGQLAKRIITEDWKEEEATTGQKSSKLWLTADVEHMAKATKKLLVGRDTPEETVEEVKPKRGEGLAKWREEQKVLKAK